MTMTPAALKGSTTAKAGFSNERDISEKFNNWTTDIEAQQWLKIMNYDLNDIEYVKSCVISGHKADIHLEITIKLKDINETENIQVKLVSNPKGFNQIDKRWVDTYRCFWNFDEQLRDILKRFTGETPPSITNPKDSRRMFLNEFEKHEQEHLTDWFNANKTLVISDLLKGRGLFSAEWFLVVLKSSTGIKWTLQNINVVLNHYSQGDVKITPRGSFTIGKITMQRKGGDAGRHTANMLQFKINPVDLFSL